MELLIAPDWCASNASLVPSGENAGDAATSVPTSSWCSAPVSTEWIQMPGLGARSLSYATRPFRPQAGFPSNARLAPIDRRHVPSARITWTSQLPPWADEKASHPAPLVSKAQGSSLELHAASPATARATAMRRRPFMPLPVRNERRPRGGPAAAREQRRAADGLLPRDAGALVGGADVRLGGRGAGGGGGRSLRVDHVSESLASLLA